MSSASRHQFLIALSLAVSGFPLLATHLRLRLRRTTCAGRSVARLARMPGRLAPALFVGIWSTGFVVARLATPHAAFELVLLVRMVLTAILLTVFAASRREQWPVGSRLGLQVLAGALLNGVYLCTSWWAISKGMPASVMALLGALQPLVVAALSFLIFGERLSGRAWVGLLVGLGGVVLVLAPLLGEGGGGTAPWFVTAGSVASILAMAAGTMVQRRPFGRDGVFASGAVQNIGGAAIAGPATVLLADYHWDNAPALWGALAWSVFMLSAGALSLLVWMTRQQGATRASVLLLLVPPLATVEAWLLFGERLSPVQELGFITALGGVLLARASTPNAESRST